MAIISIPPTGGIEIQNSAYGPLQFPLFFIGKNNKILTVRVTKPVSFIEGYVDRLLILFT